MSALTFICGAPVAGIFKAAWPFTLTVPSVTVRLT